MDHLAGETLEDALSGLSMFSGEARLCEHVDYIFVLSPRIEQRLHMESAPTSTRISALFDQHDFRLLFKFIQGLLRLQIMALNTPCRVPTCSMIPIGGNGVMISSRPGSQSHQALLQPVTVVEHAARILHLLVGLVSALAPTKAEDATDANSLTCEEQHICFHHGSPATYSGYF